MAFRQVVASREIEASGNEFQTVVTIDNSHNATLVDISITNQGSSDADNIAWYIVSGGFNNGNTSPDSQYLVDPPLTVRANRRVRLDVASMGVPPSRNIVVRNGSSNDINVLVTYFESDV